MHGRREIMTVYMHLQASHRAWKWTTLVEERWGGGGRKGDWDEEEEVRKRIGRGEKGRGKNGRGENGRKRGKGSREGEVIKGGRGE